MSNAIKSLAVNSALPALVSGWNVENGKDPVQHEDGTQTHSFRVTGPKGTVYLVDLYTKGNEHTPHGWEATRDNTTNESGYYSTGGLRIIDNTLDDMDGVEVLPRNVCALLRALGFTVSDNYLAGPL